MSSSAVVAVLMVMHLLCLSSDGSGLIYVESWKKGTRLIEERQIQIAVDTSLASYVQELRDASGKARYTLRVIPVWLRSPRADDVFLYWDFELQERRSSVRRALAGPSDNLLSVTRASADPGQDYFTYEDLIGRVDPARAEYDLASKPGVYAPPLMAERVVKVEGFFCVIKVLGVRRSREGKAEQLTAEVTLTNEDRGWKTKRSNP